MRFFFFNTVGYLSKHMRPPVSHVLTLKQDIEQPSDQWLASIRGFLMLLTAPGSGQPYPLTMQRKSSHCPSPPHKNITGQPVPRYPRLPSTGWVETLLQLHFCHLLSLGPSTVSGWETSQYCPPGMKALVWFLNDGNALFLKKCTQACFCVVHSEFEVVAKV